MSTSDINEEMKQPAGGTHYRILNSCRDGCARTAPQSRQENEIVRQNLKGGPGRIMDINRASAIAEEIFATNAELFRKLAQ